MRSFGSAAPARSLLVEDNEQVCAHSLPLFEADYQLSVAANSLI